jgi:hypothetical protein
MNDCAMARGPRHPPQLLLPEYGSRDKLHALLRTAIHNAEGFGLQ